MKILLLTWPKMKLRFLLYLNVMKYSGIHIKNTLKSEWFMRRNEKKKSQQINKLKLIAWTRTWPFLSGLREVFASRSQMYVVQSQGKEKIVNLSLFFKAKRIPKDPCWPEISVSSPWLLPWDLFFFFLLSFFLLLEILLVLVLLSL